MKTVGTSPKAQLAAALVASLGTLVAVVIAKLIDDTVLAGAVTGVALAAIAYAGAWLGAPGEVAVNADPEGNGPDVQPLHSEAGLAAFGVVGLLAVVAGILVLVLAEAFTVGLVLIIAGGLLLLADLLAGRGASL